MIQENNENLVTLCLPSAGILPRKSRGPIPVVLPIPPKIANGVEGRYTFSSPDTPGMPAPSEKTAWDFMPEGWVRKEGYEDKYCIAEAWQAPEGFEPSTQLEHADLVSSP